jgi:hypothetical protein
MTFIFELEINLSMAEDIPIAYFAVVDCGWVDT